MFTSQSIDYSLSLPTRCLCSLPSRSSGPSAAPKSSEDEDGWGESGDGWGDDDSFYVDANDESSHLFLVGTAYPSITKHAVSNSEENPDDDAEFNEYTSNNNDSDEENNQLHLLSYHEDTHEITLDVSYPHPTGEIWAMASHPKSNMVATCGGGVLLSEMGVVDEKEEGAVEPASLKGGKLVDFATKIWKLSNGDEDDFGLSSTPRLEPLITIPHGKGVTSTNSGWEKRVGCILRNPLLSSDETLEEEISASLLTVGWEANSPISLWDISAGSAVEVWSAGEASRKAGGRGKKFMPLQSALPRRASWDPHEVSNILITSGQDVVAYDTRVAAHNGVGVIRNAHRYGIADIDHNRLQENVVVTGGLDGIVKFWDLRMHLSSNEGCDATYISSPKLLKTVRGGHSHWTTRTLYNPFYDQLVLSGGSDGIANLWRVSSCSSAPLLDFDGEDDEMDNNVELDDGLVDEGNGDGAGEDWAKEEKEEYIQDNPSGEDNDKQTEKNETTAKPSSNDVRVSRFECSDTTADVCWSASDPWMYATLSCDGALVVHHVPSKEKYKILL